LRAMHLIPQDGLISLTYTVDGVATTLPTGLTWSLPPAWVNMTGLSGAVYNEGGVLSQIGASGLNTKVLVNGNGFNTNVSNPAICVHSRASRLEMCTVFAIHGPLSIAKLPALLGLTQAAYSPLQFHTFCSAASYIRHPSHTPAPARPHARLTR
jgi:hypothetical protein